MKSILKHSVTVSLLTLLSACSTAPYHAPSPRVEDNTTQPDIMTTEPESVESPRYVESYPSSPENTPAPAVKASPAAKPFKRSPAVLALLKNASKQRQKGDYRSAQNTLQRAQRIAPRDPQVYYELARTHMELETYALAEQVALKGASLVQGQPAEQKKFWNLIAEIRLQSGNAKGAEQARQRANRY